MAVKSTYIKRDCLKLEDEIAHLMCSKSRVDVFPELAMTFYKFIHRLYFELVRAGVKDVFFLSREGQPLLAMFNQYSAEKRTQSINKIRGHYLEVSRRSTLLPSLGNLESETFETLFRQYRSISLFEFLSSLALENYASEVAKALGIQGESLKERVENLPTHHKFLDLLQNSHFRHIYEKERHARRAAFLTYLNQLVENNSSKTLAIVDVGWKGTIQDNLFKILCTDNFSGIERIDGYYLGLIAPSAVTDANRKHGLLFSYTDKKSKQFNIFNENRAMFEVILAANHGSIASYEVDSQSVAWPVRGTFDEEDMIKDKIFPVQRLLLDRFGALLELKQVEELSENSFFQITADLHARMVFKPTLFERRWFSSIFHVENYGVFEHSRFDNPLANRKLFATVGFWLEFIKRKGRVELGFWPYKTLRENGGYLLASAYAYARRHSH